MSARTARRARRRKLPLSAALLALVTICSSAHAIGPPTDALMLLETHDMAETWEFVRNWNDAGAHLAHVYPPNLVIGNVPSSMEEAVLADRRVKSFRRRSEEAASLKTASPILDMVIRSWDRGLEEVGTEMAPKDNFDFERECRVIMPDENRHRELSPEKAADEEFTYGSAFGADMYHSSEWLLGRVVVAVVMPKSNGVGHAMDQQEAVVAQVRAACQFMSSQVQPLPGVQFVYEIVPGATSERDFTAGPPSANESRWVSEVMKNLGFESRTGNSEDAVYPYLDSLRIAFNTEWAVCWFLPNIARFNTAQYTAYAYLGGPFLVSPSGRDGQITTLQGSKYPLSALLLHENLHLFHALDEYDPGGAPCHLTSGYLNVQNKNSRLNSYFCQTPRQNCAMNAPAPHICSFTRGQVGIWDDDEDRIPNVLDTSPWVYVDETMPDTITTAFPVIEGFVKTLPLHNNARGKSRDITFNTVDQLIYQIDGRSWQVAHDWAGGSPREDYSFVPDSLTAGPHSIVLHGVNQWGNESNWGAKTIDVFVKAIALRDFAAVADFGGDVSLSFEVLGETFGATGDLYRKDSSGVETLIQSFPIEGNSKTNMVDGGTHPGSDYDYRLRVNAFGLEWDWETEIQAPAPVDRGNFLSAVTPNPFLGETFITYRVPRGVRIRGTGSGGGKPGDGGGGGNPDIRPPDHSPSGILEDPKFHSVHVTVDVYNVAGRLVRTLVDTHDLEGFSPAPIAWDGNNDSGDPLPPGVYFIGMKAGDDVWETTKVVLLR